MTPVLQLRAGHEVWSSSQQFGPLGILTMLLHRIGALYLAFLLLSLCDVELVASYPVSAPTDVVALNATGNANVSTPTNDTSFSVPVNSTMSGNSSLSDQILLPPPITNSTILDASTAGLVNNASSTQTDFINGTYPNSTSIAPNGIADNDSTSLSQLVANATLPFNGTEVILFAKPNATVNATLPSSTDLATSYSSPEDSHLEQQSSVEPFLAQDDTIISSDSQRAYGPAPYEVRYRALGDEDNKFDIPKHWGPYAPYFSNPAFASLQAFRAVPDRCAVKKVSLLHRHGARLPADKNSFVQWFEAGTSENASIATGKRFTFTGPLHFLNTWSYRLGRNALTPAGVQQMFDSGIQAHYRYGGLFNVSNVAHRPIVRSLTQQRVAESAKWWTRGYYGDNVTAYVDLQMQPGFDGYNSTLASNQTCPAADMFKQGDGMMLGWVNKYTHRTVNRLNRYVHNGRLTPLSVFGMQALCAHETFALGQSSFCTLFSEEEWRAFEYAFDVDFQSNYGFASQTGLAQGIGWVQELVARLTATPITTAYTSQNTTLDRNATSFPLDQAFYADFTHGRQIVSVLTAMNFTSLASVLSTEKEIDPARAFITSHVIPSAARLYVELLECDEARDSDSGDGHKHYVRAFLNDALLPMSADQGCFGRKAKRDGLCPLSSFAAHVNTVSVPKADYARTCFSEIPSRAHI